MELDCFDIASLEWFRADLVAAGFEPVPETERRLWRGPIHPAFSGLTEARAMEILFDNGWPYRPPRVFVQGLNTNHCTLEGFVCLWREGGASLQWETVDGLFGRVEDWCHRAKNGWEDDDLPFDAYLNFREKLPVMATFDFDSLGTGLGSWGDMRGAFTKNPDVLQLRPGGVSSPGELPGLWFRVGELRVPPPRNLSELGQHLNRVQRKGLQRALSKRRTSAGRRLSGGLEVILFAWERRQRPHLLVMGLAGTDDNVEAAVLMAEPNDDRTLKLRAGPDSEILKACRVVVFGAGALGGYVAVALAESGIESLRIVDGDFLSPGNVVRHVAGHYHVGKLKVVSVKAVIEDHAPWARVDDLAPPVNPAGKSEIAQLIEDSDLVIDVTGNDAFVHPVALVAEELGKPFVSGALFRGGCIGRVQRKAVDTDASIYARPDSASYPTIPPGDPESEFAEPDLGCSAPVNNALPTSVIACSSLVAQMAIDLLTRRFDFDDEAIDVYRPLPEAPFDRVGRYQRSVPQSA